MWRPRPKIIENSRFFTECARNPEIPDAVIDVFKTIRTQSLEKIETFTASHIFSLVWSYSAAKMFDDELKTCVTARLESIAAEKEKLCRRENNLKQADYTDKLHVLGEFDHFLCLAKPSGMHVNPPSDSDMRIRYNSTLPDYSMQKKVHDLLGPVSYLQEPRSVLRLIT